MTIMTMTTITATNIMTMTITMVTAIMTNRWCGRTA